MSLLLPQCLTDVFLQYNAHAASSHTVCSWTHTQPDKRHRAGCWGWSMKKPFTACSSLQAFLTGHINSEGSVLKRGSREEALFFFYLFFSSSHFVISVVFSTCRWHCFIAYFNRYWKDFNKTLYRYSWCPQDESLWLWCSHWLPCKSSSPSKFLVIEWNILTVLRRWIFIILVDFRLFFWRHQQFITVLWFCEKCVSVFDGLPWNLVPTLMSSSGCFF